MSTSGSTLSKLRETLKQEDSALSERLPAVAVPPAVGAKARSDSTAAGKPAAARKGARPAAAPGPKPKVEPRSEPAPEAKNAAEAVPPRARPDRKRPARTAASADGKASAGKEKPAKPEKVVRDSFSMPAVEHKRIKALRAALAKAGCEASKSEVLRAGLALLAARDLKEVIRVVAALPKVKKGKRGKKA